MHSMDLPYLRAYPAALQDQVRSLLAVQGPTGLGALLQRKYPDSHAVRTCALCITVTAVLQQRPAFSWT